MTRPAGIPDEFWALLDAACDGELAAADQARLEAYLSGNPDAHRAFVDHVRLRSHIRLWWKGERSRQAGLDRVEAANDECGMMNDESPREPPTAAASPIHHSSFIIHRFDHPAFFGGVLISYLVAALILGAAAVNAWLWQSPAGHGAGPIAAGDAVAATQLATPSEGVPPAPLVGRVTVVSGRRWASAAAVAASAELAAVYLGRKFTLESGLLEIVYKSGWQVILQGPATFEVNAEDGGFLSRGKLTARLDRAASGINVQGSGASRRLILHPSSLNLLPAPPGPRPQPLASFVLRTPTATVASAAGELGVEVREPQACRVCVFAGQAELRSNGSSEKGDRHHLPERPGGCFAQMVPVPFFVLCENQSAETVQLGAEQIVRPVSQPEFAAGFARRILRVVFPKMPAPDEQLAGAWLKSMGPEITEGRLIAIGSGKDIEPSGAASPAEKGRTGGAQQPFRGRDGRGGANFTARQLFEVNDVALDTALVQGWFVAQGRVSAVRFNGQTLNGLVKGLGPGNGNGGFVVGSDLVQRVNTVEIDVSEAAPPGPQNNCLMWLRLRVSGIRLPGQQAPPTPGDANQQHSKK